LICGIGNPGSFEETAKALGARVVKNFRYPDHYIFHDADFRGMNEFCHKEGIDLVVTTQKDAVKLKPWLSYFSPKLNILALEIKIQFASKEGQFLERISHIIRR
jgi:tetraacyldisaccharide 4'-kinase